MSTSGQCSLKHARLHKDEANWVSAGNTTAQGTAGDFIAQLNIAKDTFDDGAALAPGLSLTVLRPAQNGPNPVGGGELVR